jgi:Protein of unknown function (DUF998)
MRTNIRLIGSKLRPQIKIMDLCCAVQCTHHYQIVNLDILIHMTSTEIADRQHQSLKPRVLKVLLLCGILSAVAYVITDIVASMLYPGYSFASQGVSELFAIGAPTSPLVVPLFTLSSVLLLVFAFGVRMSAGQKNRALRLVALMMVGNAVDALVLWNFFPMHMRGSELTFTDTMHVIFAVNPFVLAAIVLGVFAFRNWFRFYTIGTIVISLVLTMLGFLYVSQFAAHQPTPWMGLFERISQYVSLLWASVLAIVLLREKKSEAELASMPGGSSG